MPKELQFYGNPDTQKNLKVTVNIYDPKGIWVSTVIDVPEINNEAIYIGDMPLLSPGNYVVRFYSELNFIAQGHIDWDGEKEIESLSLEEIIQYVKKSSDNIEQIILNS